MSVVDTVEQRLQRLWSRTPFAAAVPADRAVRFAEFAAVGALGAALDFGATVLLFEHLHYLLANVVGFTLAVTHNFQLNRLVTFDQPPGNALRQYLSYVTVHASTFGVRLVIIATLVEIATFSPAAATAVGIGVVVIINFLAAERIFDGVSRLSTRGLDIANRVAHRLYRSPARVWLQRVGIYAHLYGAYQWLVGRVHGDGEITVEAAGESATLRAETDSEVVSIMHTAENEREILKEFIADLDSGDVVWDVGANVGVFTTLAAQRADTVVAFEPHRETHFALGENVTRNRLENVELRPIALGASDEPVGLATARDEVGTQTATVDASGPHSVQQLRGDTVIRTHPTPTVLKVDVEGHEWRVLKGMSGIIADIETVWVEVHDDQDADIEAFLRGAGFAVETIPVGEQTYLRGVRT